MRGFCPNYLFQCLWMPPDMNRPVKEKSSRVPPKVIWNLRDMLLFYSGFHYKKIFQNIKSCLYFFTEIKMFCRVKKYIWCWHIFFVDPSHQVQHFFHFFLGVKYLMLRGKYLKTFIHVSCGTVRHMYRK